VAVLKAALDPSRPSTWAESARATGGGLGDSPTGDRDDAARINLSWLLRLRWGAAVGQLATILVASRLPGVDLPVETLCGLVALGATGNLACAAWAARTPRISAATIALLMASDVLLLTGLFRFSGGASSPFSALYLVNIALAAVILPPAWTWALVALAFACFSALFLDPGDPHAMHAAHGMGGADAGRLQLHLRGMWVAFVVAAGFITYFVQRVTRALSERDRELLRARNEIARTERLASLATLAAGAAHELSTPLATIAIAARELERQLGRAEANDATLGDVALIRSQVERCRDILVQMAADAGESTGEDVAPVSTEELVRTALRGMPEAERARVAIDDASGGATVVVPVRAVAQALRALLKNALQAAPARSPVALRGRRNGDRLEIEVRDSGAGMPPEVLARAFDPFFTTKPTGQGMGLGLFLARDVLSRVGGDIELASTEGTGTVATIRLPLRPKSPLAAHGAAA
jgi:two-component system, sensor histidine kinase RegB